MSDAPNIQVTKREFFLLLAALLATEDAPQAFNAGLVALRQMPASDGEVKKLGERLLNQIDPNHELV